MAVWSHTQHDQIKLLPFLSGDAKEVEQLLLVLGRSSVGVQFAGDPKNILLGNWDFGKQRFLCHAVVALRIIRRDMAFIAEKDKDLFPGKAFFRIALVFSQ